MGGIWFKTGGVAGIHYLSEQLQGDDPKKRYRIVVQNLTHGPDNATTTGGQLGFGTDRQISTSLTKDSSVLTIRGVHLRDIAWNDYGTACYLSIIWNEEEPGSEDNPGANINT